MLSVSVIVAVWSLMGGRYRQVGASTKDVRTKGGGGGGGGVGSAERGGGVGEGGQSKCGRKMGVSELNLKIEVLILAEKNNFNKCGRVRGEGRWVSKFVQLRTGEGS